MSKAEGSKRKPRRNGMRSGSETRQRTYVMTFRVGDADRASIRHKAERSGLSVGSFIRANLKVTRGIRATRRVPIEAELLAALLGQVGKIGGNIHQIIKRINFNEAVPHTEIDAAIADWRAVAQQIMHTLGREADDSDGN